MIYRDQGAPRATGHPAMRRSAGFGARCEARCDAGQRGVRCTERGTRSVVHGARSAGLGVRGRGMRGGVRSAECWAERATGRDAGQEAGCGAWGAERGAWCTRRGERRAGCGRRRYGMRIGARAGAVRTEGCAAMRCRAPGSACGTQILALLARRSARASPLRNGFGAAAAEMAYSARAMACSKSRVPRKTSCLYGFTPSFLAR